MWVVKFHLYLKNEYEGKKGEFELSKQILRSGTSIGANIEEAIGGLSRKDFSSRIGIAHKEARETSYWLRTFSQFETAQLFKTYCLRNDWNNAKHHHTKGEDQLYF
ncbi:MAG: four helix bundle protein [Ignavibacteria bacterium]|nr:four helix bundle protein [Ignavibacteria bacterium]